MPVTTKQVDEAAARLAAMSDIALAKEWVRLERISCATRYAEQCFAELSAEMGRRGFDISDFDGDEISPSHLDRDHDEDLRFMTEGA